MIRRWLLIAVLLAPLAAEAQEETRLSLSETGTALRLPDQPVATLRVEARAASAAAAQGQVNRVMAAAVEEARKVSGVVASTGRYGTQRVDDNKAWLATQRLDLRGGDGAALADLVGALQGRGLALEELSWRLSPEQQREARDEATRAGLASLRERAAMIAAELGLSLRRIDRLAVDASLDMPFRRSAPVAMSARAAPPVSLPQEATVTSRISAEILLGPR